MIKQGLYKFAFSRHDKIFKPCPDSKYRDEDLEILA